ncbi:MAG: hypothetical protein AB7S39_06360 [Gemmatimonadales bacterium]
MAVLLAAALACSDGPVGNSDRLELGTWGGDKAAVIATDSVTHIHIGCTFGDVVGRVALDAEGRFSVAGTYVLQAYPIVLGPEFPAQFAGQVVRDRLTLAVTVNDTVTGKPVLLGPITVRFGKNPEMAQCPICKAPRLPGVKREAGSDQGARSGAEPQWPETPH